MSNLGNICLINVATSTVLLKQN